MNLRNALRGLFSRGSRPSLRNKPGGLAFIRTDAPGGIKELNGQVVTTVALMREGMWRIEPRVFFVATSDLVLRPSGVVCKAGSMVSVDGMGDQWLEPIRPVGDAERDESAAWLPPVPTRVKEPA